MKLINIGFGNMISFSRLVSILGFDSAPIKRLVQDTKKRGYLIDATYGRKTQSVLIMDSGHVVLSAVSAHVISSRAIKDMEDVWEEEA